MSESTNEAIDEMILATYELDAAFDRRDAPATLAQLNRLKAGVEAYKQLRAARGDLLAATLIEIVLQGHEFIYVTRIPSTGWRCRSYRATPPCPHPGDPGELWTAWHAAVEDGEATNDDPVAAAEARLAQIRALHVPATPVHFEHETFAVCGTDEDQRLTSDPAAVTCPDCRRWIGIARADRLEELAAESGGTAADVMDALMAAARKKAAREDRHRESEASEGRSPGEVDDLHDATSEEEGR